MFWLIWAWSNIVNARKALLPMCLFLVTANMISFLAFISLSGASTQARKSLIALNGEISLISNSPEGYGPDDLARIQAIVSSAGDDAVVVPVTKRYAYLVNEYGYFRSSFLGIESGTEGRYLLNSLAPHLGWLEQGKGELDGDSIIIPAGIAKKMRLHAGDRVNALYESLSGEINSLSLSVSAVYFGSSLLYGETSFISAADCRSLFSAPGLITEFRFYLRGADTRRENAWRLYDQILEKRGVDDIVKSSSLFPNEDSVIQLLGYYVAFIVAILAFFTTATQVVSGIALKNYIYLDFLRRKNEFSTLRTFGLKTSSLALLVALQSILLGAITLTASFMVSTVLAFVAKAAIEIKDPRFSEIMNVIGGNRLFPHFPWRYLSGYCLLAIALLVAFSLSGLRSYMKSDVRLVIQKIS